MDTSDPGIEFDREGICNHCRSYAERVASRLISRENAETELKRLVTQIKSAGAGKEYDCVVGISGGVDSTYVCFLAKKLGLRPLAVHFDNGWNSELAVHNIEGVLRKLDIDLFTYVVDWAEFRDLQLSFLKASTPDSEIPTDHAIFAVLMQVAAQRNIKYVLSGTNFRTEGVYVESWGYGHNDWRYIKGLHRRFGTKKLRTFPRYSLWYLFYVMVLKRVRFVSLLNYVEYDKKEAMSQLEKELGWRPYSGKHHESIYTRFFQSYILPLKFGVDKRRSHLSALIYSSSGEYGRAEAVQELQSDIMPPHAIAEDREFVVKKLGIPSEEFDRIMTAEPRSFRDFSSNYELVKFLRKLQLALRKFALIPK